MQALTFDIGPGWVDCHVMLSSFEEVVLRYPLLTEDRMTEDGMTKDGHASSVLDRLPVVQGGSLEALPDAFLKTFHQAVRTRFWLLAQQLQGRKRLVTLPPAEAEDAA
jgi:hypothetical protein